MNLSQYIRFGYLAYFSQPSAERTLYRLIRKRKLQKIVEVGIGDGTRAARLIEAASWSAGAPQVRYTAIDLFEARDPSVRAGLSLKEAHRRLQATGAQIHLVPGDPFSALARVANSLTGTELLILAADQDPASLERAWYYLPRMIGPATQVLVETAAVEGKPPGLCQLAAEEIAIRASKQVRRRAA